MPGFFDVIFGSSPAEPAEPKPKKVKKVKDDNTLIKKLEAEIIELKKMINKPKQESEPDRYAHMRKGDQNGEIE